MGALPTIAIRADASLAIGSGHVVRCLALAAALRARGARLTFLAKSLTPDLAEKIAAAGIGIRHLPEAGDDAAACLQALAAAPVDALIVDHYGLDAAWEQALRPAARRIVVIDDLANRPHDCDWLVDQNYHPDAEQRYRGLVPAACRLLLGPRYALLRPQFADCRDRLKPSPRTALSRLLICFGGTDAADYTCRALEAFVAAKLPGVVATAVVGGTYSYSRWPALESRFGHRPDICLRRDAADMPELMAAADLFLGSGGSMTWERAALKLPGITVAIADNQQELCRDLAGAGAGLHLEAPAEGLVGAMADALRLLHGNGALLAAFSRTIGEMADGHGARRVARRIMPTALQVRPARADDCDAVFAWRNDPATRRYARDGREFGIDEHRAWYARNLADPARPLLIAERAATAEPVGVLRYDLEGNEATISVYLVPGLQGRGLGVEVIGAGDRWLKTNYPNVTRVRADVLADNAASAAAFAAAGYRLVRKQFVHDMDWKDRD